MERDAIARMVSALKKAIANLWKDSSFRPLARVLDDFREEFKSSNLSANLTFDIVIHSHDKGVEAKPILRIPLAMVSLVRGLGKCANTDAMRILELSQLEERDAEQEQELRALIERVEHDPQYSVMFSETPDILNRGPKICPTCQGGGIRLSSN